MFEKIKNWAKARWTERSSFDGFTIIGASLILWLAHALLGWLVPWFALLGVAYGIYQVVKTEE